MVNGGQLVTRGSRAPTVLPDRKALTAAPVRPGRMAHRVMPAPEVPEARQVIAVFPGCRV